MIFAYYIAFDNKKNSFIKEHYVKRLLINLRFKSSLSKVPMHNDMLFWFKYNYE